VKNTPELTEETGHPGLEPFVRRVKAQLRGLIFSVNMGGIAEAVFRPMCDLFAWAEAVFLIL